MSGSSRAASAYICSRQVQNVPAPGLCATAKRAVKGVRVDVGEAGKREARQPGRIRLAARRHPARRRRSPHPPRRSRRRPRRDRRQARRARRDMSVTIPPVSTSARARASNSSRPLRSNCSQVVSVRGSARSTKRTPSRWSSSCWKVPAVSPRRISSCSDAVTVEVAHAGRSCGAGPRHGGSGPKGSPR